MKKETNLSKYFLFLALGVSLVFAYLIFKPFLSVILLAAIFVSILYPVYTWFQRITKGRDSIAALLSVLVFVLLIVIPLGNFVVLLAKESSATYAVMQEKFSSNDVNTAFLNLFKNAQFLQEKYLPFIDLATVDVKQLVLDLGGKFNAFILSAASNLIRGTTQLLTSLFFLLLSMYFMFKDGKVFAQRLAFLTPLSNKYDQELFDKFREVGRSTILSSLLIGVVQGTMAGIAYAIIGFPAFFLGVATAICSFIPIVGTALISIPVLIALAIMGHWYAFIFVAIWCLGIVTLVDNVIRTVVVKGASEIHPLLIFFSIFGGIEVFGVQGIIFGPLVLAIMMTLVHIYELEYEQVLER